MKTFVIGSPENIYSPVINKKINTPMNLQYLYLGSQGSEYIANYQLI